MPNPTIPLGRPEVVRALRDEDAPPYDAGESRPTGFRVVAEGPRFSQLWHSVLYDPEVTPSAVKVYAILQDYAFRYGEESVFPTQDTIAADAHMNRKTVAAALDLLESRGHIRREARGFGETRRVILASPVRPKNGHTVSKNRTNGVRKTDTMKEEKDLEETSPTGDEHAARPYDVFAAVCDEAGLDAGAFRQSDVSAQCKVAQRLMRDGLTLEEARAVTRYLRGQSWRTDPVTVWSVQRELGKWRAAGRPEREKPARPRTQAEMNRGGTGKPVY